MSLDIEVIEELLTQACDKAVAEGWVLTRGITHSEEMHRCCPIGAYAIEHGLPAQFALERVTTELGFPEADSRYFKRWSAFVAGFDGLGRVPASLVTDPDQASLRALGARLAKRYVK